MELLYLSSSSLGSRLLEILLVARFLLRKLIPAPAAASLSLGSLDQDVSSLASTPHFIPRSQRPQIL